jgi:hypothetical protein
LAFSFQNEGKDLSIGLSVETVSHIRHSLASSRETVGISLHLLVDLGLEAAEILAISVEDCRVRKSLRKSGRGGR